MNILKLIDKFDEIYHYLYEQQEAKKRFDSFCINDENINLLRAFVRARGDAVSSDREAAAFMLALEALKQEE